MGTPVIGIGQVRVEGVNDDPAVATALDFGSVRIGLVHSPRALGGFLVGGFPGGGLCLGSKDDACARARYSTVGLLGRYHLLDDPVILAADGGFVINDFDPFALSLKLGATGEWQYSDKIAVLFAANLNFGLSERDAGNKEFFNLPVSVMYQVMPKLAAGVQTGFRTPLQDAGDLYSIPFGFGARYIVSPKIIIDGSFTLPLLITGVPDSSGVAARALTIGGGYIF